VIEAALGVVAPEERKRPIPVSVADESHRKRVTDPVH
jgi:hypothetical protein